MSASQASEEGSSNTATELRFPNEESFVTWLVSEPDDEKEADSLSSLKIRVFEQSNGAFAVYGSDSDTIKHYLNQRDHLPYDSKHLRSTDQFVSGLYISQRVLHDWLVNNEDHIDESQITLYRCMDSDDDSDEHESHSQGQFHYRLISDEQDKVQTLYQTNREHCMMHVVIVKREEESSVSLSSKKIKKNGNNVSSLLPSANRVFVSAATRVGDRVTWVARFCDTNLLSDLSAIMLSHSVDTCYACFIDERYSQHDRMVGQMSDMDEETMLDEITRLSKMIRNANTAISKVCRRFIVMNDRYHHSDSDDVFYLNSRRQLFDKDCLAADLYRGLQMNSSDDTGSGSSSSSSDDCKDHSPMRPSIMDSSELSRSSRASGKRRRLSDMNSTDTDIMNYSSSSSASPVSGVYRGGNDGRPITTAVDLLRFYRLDVGHHSINEDDWFALHLCCSHQSSDEEENKTQSKFGSADSWKGLASDVRTLDFYQPSNYLRLDKASLSALNVFPLASDSVKESSLFGLLNQCRTDGGKNKLRQWLNQPLTNDVMIRQRQALIAIFKDDSNYEGRQSLYQRWLKSVPKFSRMQKQWQSTRDKLTGLVMKEQQMMDDHMMGADGDREEDDDDDDEVGHGLNHHRSCNNLTNLQQSMMETSISNLSVMYSFLIGGFNGIISALKEITIEGDNPENPYGLCKNENEMMDVRRKLEDEFLGSLERWKRKCVRYERMCETFLDLEGKSGANEWNGRSSSSSSLRGVTSISPEFDEHLKYLNDEMIQTKMQIQDYYHQLCKSHSLKKATLKQVKSSDIAMLGSVSIIGGTRSSRSSRKMMNVDDDSGGVSHSSAQQLSSSFVIRLPKGEATRKLLNELESKSKMRTVKESKNDKWVSSLKLQDLSQEYFQLRRDYLNWTARLVWQMIGTVQTFYPLFNSLSSILSEVDVLVSMAEVSILYGWERPSQVQSMSNGDRIVLSRARHPCLDAILRSQGANSLSSLSYPSSSSSSFDPDSVDDWQRACVPNDISLIRNESNFQLITGPNMGGKSTILRTVALIILMNQCGSLLPLDGDNSVITVVDSILTRIGASDNELEGVSTFLSEMIDVRHIQDCVSEYSLVIVDELGRGTSTRDGYAIAETFSEYLIEQVKCFTLFATHFHELATLSDRFPNEVVNKQVCIDPGSLNMTFKMADGYCESSFGIEIAKRVGFPERLILRAKKHALKSEIMYCCRMNPEIHEFLNDLAKKLRDGIITDDDKKRAIQKRAETDTVLAKICAKSRELSEIPAV